MVQSKRSSNIEVGINTTVGFFTAMVLNLFFLPHFIEGIMAQSMVTAIIVGVVYTFVSYVRSYIFRRLFNRIEIKIHHKKTLKKQPNFKHNYGNLL